MDIDLQNDPERQIARGMMRQIVGAHLNYADQDDLNALLRIALDDVQGKDAEDQVRLLVHTTYAGHQLAWDWITKATLFSLMSSGDFAAFTASVEPRVFEERRRELWDAYVTGSTLLEEE